MARGTQSREGGHPGDRASMLHSISNGHERTPDRQTYRNGFRDRALDTRLGTLQLRIPKLRQGSYFPPFLDARKTSEKALVAVIQEAWIGGVSTRRVDELVQAMGLSGIRRARSPSCARTSTSA